MRPRSRAQISRASISGPVVKFAPATVTNFDKVLPLGRAFHKLPNRCESRGTVLLDEQDATTFQRPVMVRKQYGSFITEWDIFGEV
jgi:hypothetical protein